MLQTLTAKTLFLVLRIIGSSYCTVCPVYVVNQKILDLDYIYAKTKIETNTRIINV